MAGSLPVLRLAVLPPPGVRLALIGPLCRVPRQAPVLSRPCSSLEFCLPLCAQAALPHVFSMTGEVGRATCPWLEGNTVASEARRGRKDGSNVQGHSDLC